MSSSYIQSVQSTYFQAVSTYHQTQDTKGLTNLHSKKDGWGPFAKTEVDSKALAETIHTYFGGERIDGSEFFKGKSVLELTHFKKGLEDIQKLGGTGLERTLTKVDSAIKEKESEQAIRSVAVAKPKSSHKKREKAEKREPSSPISSPPPPKSSGAPKPHSSASFQAGMDPARFMADNVIQSTTTKTTTKTHSTVAPASNPLANDPRYGKFREGARVVPSDNPFHYPKVYAPKTTQSTTTSTQTSTEDHLMQQRAKVLGKKD